MDDRLVDRLLPTPGHPYRRDPPDHPDVDTTEAGLTALIAEALLRAAPGSRLDLVTDPEAPYYNNVQVVRGDRGFELIRVGVLLSNLTGALSAEPEGHGRLADRLDSGWLANSIAEHATKLASAAPAPAASPAVPSRRAGRRAPVRTWDVLAGPPLVEIDEELERDYEALRPLDEPSIVALLDDAGLTRLNADEWQTYDERHLFRVVLARADDGTVRAVETAIQPTGSHDTTDDETLVRRIAARCAAGIWDVEAEEWVTQPPG